MRPSLPACTHTHVAVASSSDYPVKHEDFVVNNNFNSPTMQEYAVSDERKEDQNVVDDQLLPAIKNVPYLKGYLATKFSLQTGQYPHQMVF